MKKQPNFVFSNSEIYQFVFSNSTVINKSIYIKKQPKFTFLRQ